jgi:hypothetical protein
MHNYLHFGVLRLTKFGKWRDILLRALHRSGGAAIRFEGTETLPASQTVHPSGISDTRHGI